MEFLIRDRLSWLRFLGFDLGEACQGSGDAQHHWKAGEGAVTPDEHTIQQIRLTTRPA